MKKLLLVSTILFSLLDAKGQQGWQYQNSNLTTNSWGHGAISPINNDTVFIIADSNKFLKTFDGGANWILQNTGFSNHFFDLSFINADTGYAVGQNGIIIKTTNAGTNWTALSSGTNKDLFSIFKITSNDLWVVGDSGLILNSVDYGITWIKNDTLTNKKLNSICFRNSSIGFIAGNNGTLFGTVNGGINWDTINIATTKDLYSLTVTDNYAYLLAGWIMDYYFDSDELFKTNDNINWTNNSLGTSIPGLAKLYFQNDSLGFTIASNCIVKGCCGIVINKTIDFGQNWDYSLNNWDYNDGVGIGYSDLIFVTDSIGYAFSGNYILKTTDGGIIVNTKDFNFNNSIKIYPNPFSTQTIIQVGFDLHNATLTMDNCLGQTLKQIKNISGQSIILQRDNLPSGLYFLQLTQDNKILTIDKILITDK